MSLRSFKTIPGSGAFAGVLWIAFAAILAPASIYSAFYFCKSTELTSAQALGYLGGWFYSSGCYFHFRSLPACRYAAGLSDM